MAGRREATLEKALGLGDFEIVALVGGGGKTSLLYALLREYAAKSRLSVAGATTTKMLPPDARDPARLVLGGDVATLLERWQEEPEPAPLFGEELLEDGKVKGLSLPLCEALIREGVFHLLVVEADGARRLPLKAPEAHEPVVPPRTTTFVAVVGLSCLGKPLDEKSAYNPEGVARCSGLSLGEPVTPEGVARLLLHPEGLGKGAPEGARKIVFLNQADSKPARAAAEEIAALLRADRASPWHRVVAARLQDKLNPKLEVWKA